MLLQTADFIESAVFLCYDYYKKIQMSDALIERFYKYDSL